jgi:hypothetical protein
LGIYLLRLLTQLFIIKKCMIRLNEKKFLLFTPFFEMFLMLVNLILGFRGLFTKKAQW